METKGVPMKNVSRYGGWAILLAVFLSMWALNHWTPLHRDDYEYALVWQTSIHLQNWSDVFHSLVRHYMQHGGRMVAFFTLDGFLLYHKSLFNIANALIYTSVLLLILWHSLGRIAAPSWRRTALAAFLAWFCFPHFAEVAVWMCGSTVYLWNSFWLLLFLLPYRLAFAGRNLRHPTALNFGMPILGILAGWGLENASLTALLLAALALIAMRRKQSTSPWMYAGIGGCLCGFIALVIAPGNMVRSLEQHGDIWRRIGNQFAGNIEMMLYILPLILAGVLAYRAWAKAQHGSIAKPPKYSTCQLAALLIPLILICGFSYWHGSVIGQTIGNILVKSITYIHPLRLQTMDHILNITTRLEETLLYITVIYSCYIGCAAKLTLRRTAAPQSSLADFSRRSAALRFALCLVVAAFLNNLIMLGAPTFPARATYFSVILLIIALLSLGNDPIIDQIFRPHAIPVSRILLVLYLPFYLSTFYCTIRLYNIDHERIAFIQQLPPSHRRIVHFTALPAIPRMHRHIFYVDWDNPVSKGGLIRYYQIGDIVIDPQK